MNFKLKSFKLRRNRKDTITPVPVCIIAAPVEDSSIIIAKHFETRRQNEAAARQAAHDQAQASINSNGYVFVGDGQKSIY